MKLTNWLYQILRATHNSDTPVRGKNGLSLIFKEGVSIYFMNYCHVSLPHPVLLVNYSLLASQHREISLIPGQPM